MKKCVVGLSLLALGLAVLLPAYAKSPVEVKNVAPVEDLAAEANAKIAELSEYLQNNEAYLANKMRKVPQAAGVLACMAQAIVEHEDSANVSIAAADLRDAALALAKSDSFDAATAALAKVKEAAEGKASGNAAAEYKWDKLIDSHMLMEEVNARNAQIRRVLRRPQDPATDSLHATTMAVLALSIHAYSSEMVEDEADLPKWNEYSVEFQKSMTELAAAMKKEDATAGREHWLAGAKSCNGCHQDFRDD